MKFRFTLPTNLFESLFGDIRPIECPFEEKPDKVRRTYPKPDTYFAGIPFNYVRDTEPDVYEEIRIGHGQTGRTSQLSEIEKETLAQQFDPAKYAELKSVWAKGLSAAQAAQIYTGRRGYSLRTIEKFWSVFNSIGEETP